MRVLVAGSRLFCAGYRIERAMTRVSAKKRSRDMTLVTVGRNRRGADRTAADIAEATGWAREKAETVSQAQADVCLAFLHTQDAHDAPARITAMKAEKAGIPVWRYYEGQQVRPEVEVHDDFEPEPWTIDWNVGYTIVTAPLEAF